MGWWQRMRVTAMVWMARLSWRSPSRLSRCRSVRPEDTGTGAVPESIANACSLRIRPAWDQDSRTSHDGVRVEISLVGIGTERVAIPSSASDLHGSVRPAACGAASRPVL